MHFKARSYFQSYLPYSVVNYTSQFVFVTGLWPVYHLTDGETAAADVTVFPLLVFQIENLPFRKKTTLLMPSHWVPVL